jgi:hypothetical protein
MTKFIEVTEEFAINATIQGEFTDRAVLFSLIKLKMLKVAYWQTGLSKVP